MNSHLEPILSAYAKVASHCLNLDADVRASGQARVIRLVEVARYLATYKGFAAPERTWHMRCFVQDVDCLTRSDGALN
jgi:hypothetical protein